MAQRKSTKSIQKRENDYIDSEIVFATPGYIESEIVFATPDYIESEIVVAGQYGN